MSVFVHAQGIKTVHVVVECPHPRDHAGFTFARAFPYFLIFMLTRITGNRIMIAFSFQEEISLRN